MAAREPKPAAREPKPAAREPKPAARDPPEWDDDPRTLVAYLFIRDALRLRVWFNGPAPEGYLNYATTHIPRILRTLGQGIDPERRLVLAATLACSCEFSDDDLRSGIARRIDALVPYLARWAEKTGFEVPLLPGHGAPALALILYGPGGAHQMFGVMFEPVNLPGRVGPPCVAGEAAPNRAATRNAMAAWGYHLCVRGPLGGMLTARYSITMLGDLMHNDTKITDILCAAMRQTAAVPPRVPELA